MGSEDDDGAKVAYQVVWVVKSEVEDEEGREEGTGVGVWRGVEQDVARSTRGTRSILPHSTRTGGSDRVLADTPHCDTPQEGTAL